MKNKTNIDEKKVSRKNKERPYNLEWKATLYFYVKENGIFPNSRSKTFFADRVKQWIGEYTCGCSVANFDLEKIPQNCPKHGDCLIIKPFKVDINSFLTLEKLFTINEENLPTDANVTDHFVFGINRFVYCDQHLNPHLTGWCSVSHRNKVDLGVETLEEAYEKCKRLGLKLYEGNKV